MTILRVLVVDDSPTIRKLVEISFRSTDWSVHFAPSGADGIALAKRLAPDVVLLDFVLPDMRGTEVCAELSRDRRTSNIPVVLMTAKGENVRELFGAYPQVVDYVAKPFTKELIVDVVRNHAGAREDGASLPSRGAGLFTHAQQERAAQAMYARLKQAFAHIPAWLAAAGTSAPGPYFARKILTPERISELLEALAPVYREAFGADADSQGEEDGAGFAGHVASWPIADVVTLFGASHRSGEVTFAIGGASFLAYFARGELVMATSRDPESYARGAVVDMRGVEPRALERAKAEQRRTGKPLFVSLAEAGELAGVDLGATLHGCSKRLVLDVLGARAGRFRWRDLAALPEYVEAYGRHVSLSRATLMFGAPSSDPPPASSLAQLTLERLRRTHAECGDSVPPPPPDTVYARTRGFSRRLAEFQISPDERTVLALVDGHSAVEDIAAKTKVPPKDVALALDRLATVGLLYPNVPGEEQGAFPPPSSSSRGRGPVLILEPDMEGFQRPLESLLKNRPDPIALVSVSGTGDLCKAARTQRPRLVIVNAEAAGDALGAAAREIRGSSGLADVSLVAILEPPASARRDELSRAGFNAVLVKPILYTDLEKLLA